MKLSRMAILLLLLWPVVGVLGLIGLKEHTVAVSTVTRMPITGYDPRHLMYGHFLMFRFAGNKPLDTKPHEYYIPEAEAPVLDRLLRQRKQSMEVDVLISPSGKMTFGNLYIDGMPWREYLKQNPQAAEKQP